jgi:hypothetical protein
VISKLRHHWNVSSRREFFTQAGSGLAGLALTCMLAEEVMPPPLSLPIPWP